MGNSGSNGRNGHRRNGGRQSNPPPTPQQQPGMTANQYVFAAATPYPNPNPNPYYRYPGFYPVPGPYDQRYQQNWEVGRYPYPVMHQGPQVEYVEHQKAVTIKNDVNLKKESLRVVADEEHPGKFLVEFSFDATVAGSITLIFFAKEGEDCKLTSMKEDILPPITIHFEKGLGQKFKQSSGTGIDFAMFEEAELLKEADTNVFPLAVKAEASPVMQDGADGNPATESQNSQITQAVFEKDKGEYSVRVVKQILWVNGIRYELQEIYGIGNSSESENDGNDLGKECVICLSEPQDTTVLPCRHMCMCSECAKVLRFQTNRCPICRQPVERLLEIKVNNESDE